MEGTGWNTTVGYPDPNLQKMRLLWLTRSRWWAGSWVAFPVWFVNHQQVFHMPQAAESVGDGSCVLIGYVFFFRHWVGVRLTHHATSPHVCLYVLLFLCHWLIMSHVISFFQFRAQSSSWLHLLEKPYLQKSSNTLWSKLFCSVSSLASSSEKMLYLDKVLQTYIYAFSTIFTILVNQQVRPLKPR